MITELTLWPPMKRLSALKEYSEFTACCESRDMAQGNFVLIMTLLILIFSFPESHENLRPHGDRIRAGTWAGGSELNALCCLYNISLPRRHFLPPINKRIRSHSPRLPKLNISHLDSAVLSCQLYRPQAIKSPSPGSRLLIILSLFSIFSTTTHETPISNFCKGAKWLLHCVVKVYHQPNGCKEDLRSPGPGL